MTDRREAILAAARRPRRPLAGRVPQEQLDAEVRAILAAATPPAPPDPLTRRPSPS